MLVVLPLRPASASTPSATGIIIPLYIYPGSAWSTVAALQVANPNVPIIAVINPDSGPGASVDPNYASGISSLRSAGVTVLGYVPTDYAATSIQQVESMISLYKSWYPVNGIFFDQMSNVPGNEGYYSALSAYSSSLGLTYTVGNPGADVPASYVGTVDTIVIYENQGLPSTSFLAGWHSAYPKSDFAAISYGVGSVTQSYLSTASEYTGYIYVTNGSMPNPYGALPPYLSSVASALQTANALRATFPVTVDSASLTGSPINGMWTVVQSGGSVVAEGFTPLTFNATYGATYAVSVANYGNYVFDHWSDGVLTAVNTVTPTQAETLLAYYQTGPTTFPVTVDSASLTGSPINGMWTVVQSGGSVVAEGFTPLAFTAVSGQSYTISVANYQNYVFEHWSDGALGSVRTIAPNSATTLTADYQV